MSNFASAVPSTIRDLIRKGSSIQPTYGWCKGYLQANIQMLPAKFAEAFETFCALNPSSCPLLYRSKPGEVGAPPIATDTDIRTDLPQYWHHKNGKFFEELTDLKQFKWDDMVTFYLGCSFGFEESIQQAGLVLPKIEEGKNVSMYITNIKCNPSPPFSTNMVLSMRPVKKNQVEKIFKTTYNLDCVHGAPVHIGNPAALGIHDILKVDYGDPVDSIKNDEVPVFWACGVTAIRAIQAAALPQCFSHAPGRMFIADVLTTAFQDTLPSPYADRSPRVLQISGKPEVYSVLSDITKDQLERLEQLLLNDPGKRGVQNIFVKGDFVKSSLRLYSTSSVGIITGFPIFSEHPVTQETDGIPGAISIAKALCAMGKDVHFVIERKEEALLNRIQQHCVASGILKDVLPVLVYERQEQRHKAAVQFLYPDGIDEAPRFDHLISIERTGPAVDGTYRSMKGATLDESLVAPIEDLFLQAKDDDRITTSSIGDGGNELGMGKVLESVQKCIKNGEMIACNVASDYLITAGVSNWGGHALSVALYLLSTCPIHTRYAHYGLVRVGHQEKSVDDFVNTVEQEAEVLQILVNEGVHDGISGKCENSVDGLSFYPHHADLIRQLNDVVEEKAENGEKI